MDCWFGVIVVHGVIWPLVYLVLNVKKEKLKNGRIELFKKMDNSKIRAIGFYEEKAKTSNLFNKNKNNKVK